MKKIVQSTRREVVDSETGEISVIEDSKVFREKIEEDSFYMIFTQFIAPYYKLTSDSARKLLVWMCEHAEFNTGVVLLATATRVEVGKALSMSNNAITNNLNKLKKLNLISGDKGRFKINPQIFWKGDTKTRRKILEDHEFKITFKIG